MNDRKGMPLCECGQARLEAEGSVPLGGFSRELRAAPDVQRFRFPFPLRGEAVWPVHIVFSPAQGRAEIKAADLKAYRVEGVASACEAQARWIAWWAAGRARAPFAAPRRAGRWPHSAAAAS